MSARQPGRNGQLSIDLTPASPGSIQDRAIALSVTLRRFGNSRKLSTDAVEVDADKSLIGVRKRLLEGAALKAISGLDSSILAAVYNRSLPSMFKDGIYLVPTDLVNELDAKLEELKAERERLVENFAEAYPYLIEEAAARLRSVFDPRDYPSAEQVRESFSMEWYYVDLGAPRALQGVSRQLFNKEAAKQAALWDDAMQEIRQVLRLQLQGMVDHMVDRLSGRTEEGKPKVFRDTLTERLNDFLSTFSPRNLTDDEELQALVGKARDLMAGVSPDLLRRSEAVRDTVAQGFGSIKTELDQMMVDKPKRAIRFEDE